MEDYWNAARSPESKSKIRSMINTDIPSKYDESQQPINTTSALFGLPESNEVLDLIESISLNSDFPNTSVNEMNILSEDCIEPCISDSLVPTFNNTSGAQFVEHSVSENFMSMESSIFNLTDKYEEINTEALNYGHLSFTNIEPPSNLLFSKDNPPEPSHHSDILLTIEMEKDLDSNPDNQLISFAIDNNESSIVEEPYFEYDQPIISSFSNSDSNENQFEDVPEEHISPKIRRSQRKKYTPLAYWKNERVVYGRRESCAKLSLPAILDVIRYSDIGDTDRTYKDSGPKKRRLRRNFLTASSKTKRNSRKKKILALAQKLERLGFEECKEVSGPIVFIDSNVTREIPQRIF